MKSNLALTSCLILALTAAPLALADDLTRIIQEDLQELGYDPGRVDGEFSTRTAIAVSQFEADHGLDVTGEISPQLAGKIKAAMKGTLKAPGSAPATAGAAPAAAPGSAPPAAASPQDLQAMQQACLQEKIAAAKASQEKKRGFGRLLSAASRVGQRFGVGSDMAQVTRDLYDVNATAADLSAAAEDLGLTEDDIEACRNPAALGGR